MSEPRIIDVTPTSVEIDGKVVKKKPRRPTKQAIVKREVPPAAWSDPVDELIAVGERILDRPEELIIGAIASLFLKR